VSRATDAAPPAPVAPVAPVADGRPVLSAWQQPVWKSLCGALDADRLGHALLLTGPPLIGKAGLAEALAWRLLCNAPAADGLACGRCRNCALLAAGNHPDRRRVTLLERDDGRLKSEIGVDQIRELSAWFALTPQLGRAQVALIEPADRLNASSANALLKTLEEPMPARYLVLISARPQRLPATIRSRCQHLPLQSPAPEVARAALVEAGLPAEQLDEALAAADGHPGLARQYLQDGSLALRAEVRDALAALAAGRVRAASLAATWAGDRTELRLRLAADCVREFGRKRAAKVTDPSSLTGLGDFPKLAVWFDRANRVREQLAAPLRHELLLAELLAEWRAAFVRPGR
jgi:DNA polymerase III subunit delta'